MRKKMLAVLTATLLFANGLVSAAIVTISGQGSLNGQWDVTTVTGTYTELSSTLESQAWFGNEAAAGAFATAVGALLGLPNNGFPSDFGPSFVWSATSNIYNAAVWSSSALGFTPNVPTSTPNTFAVATRAAVPEPGTLGMVALGVAGLVAAARRRVS